MKKINQTYYQQCTFRPFCFVSCADAFLSITSTRNFPPKIVKRQMWDALQRSDLKKNWWKYTKLHFYGLTNQRTAFFEWKESGHQQQTERNHQQEEQEKCDQYVSVCSDLKNNFQIWVEATIFLWMHLCCSWMLIIQTAVSNSFISPLVDC